VEATPEPGERLPDALDRIEAAVTAGQADLQALGFWRAVAVIKRDPVLIEAHADQVGRIDGAAFRSNLRPLFAVWLGNAVLLLGVAFGAFALILAHLMPSATYTEPSPQFVVGVACLVAGLVWSVAVHCPAHWVFGRIVGIRFTAYSFGGPFPPRPGLKTDYATYLRTPPGRRAWFHASGAIATKSAPFLALLLAPWALIPWWSVLGLLGLGVLQIATDVLFSVKTSDWKKFRREMAVARAVAAG